MKYPSNFPKTNQQLHQFINVNLYELLQMCVTDVNNLELFEDELREYIAGWVPDNKGIPKNKVPQVSATAVLAACVYLYAILSLENKFTQQFKRR